MRITEAVVAIIVSIGFYGITAAFLFGLVGMRRRRAELQAEVQTKLIDRFGTAPELIAFLQSEAGRRFVSGFHDAPRHAARNRILRGLRSGIVVSLLGLGFIAVFLIDTRENWGFMYPGFILFALGLGFLGASWLSMKLSRTWGLIDDDQLPPANA